MDEQGMERMCKEDESGEFEQNWNFRLACCDALHVEFVPARPSHLVFSLAVRAEGHTLDFFGKPRGSHQPHPALTLLTSNYFLHVSSLP